MSRRNTFIRVLGLLLLMQASGFLQNHIGNYGSYDPCSLRRPSCDPNYKYRSIDGSCNNLNNPTWGMANTRFTRILPVRYRDGVYLPPVSINGNLLPSARILSSSFFPDVNNNDNVSLAGMQWGQFLAHDLLHTANINNSEQINCCNEPLASDEKVCLPIEIPPTDPFYSQFNITCQNLVRNAFVLSKKCNEVAEQFNQVTHLLDGSQIYGSDPNVAQSLREFKSGRLLVRTCRFDRTFLPTVSLNIPCNTTEKDVQFRAGDTRVNQNPQLTILHTLFVREHNRVVGRLQQLHPDWNDETLFQEGRAIIISELQHITYNEWLPLILGKSVMVKYDLFSSTNRHFTYNIKLIPVAINSFASSAFRIGHSAIQGQLSLFSSYNECPVRNLNFSDWLDKPGIILKQKYFDQFIRGLTKQPMQKVDLFYTHQITEQLFHGNRSYGIDLVSIDIQRGRDHGVPSYIDVLHFCTGYKPQTFRDLTRFIKPKMVSQLQQHYANVNDIDLFIGGNLETASEGARVGPTFQCIIAKQFYRHKYGDRFWYEIREQQHSFTNGQLYEIKKVTFSRIICDNSDGIAEIASKSFLQLSHRNRVVPCKNLPALNLSRWR